MSEADTERRREWLRILIKKYLAKYIRDYMVNKHDTPCSPITSEIMIHDENGNTGIHASGSGQVVTFASPHPPPHPRGHTRHARNNAISEGAVEESLSNMVTIGDFEITEETALGDDRITYLSNILSLTVPYSVTGHPDHIMQWLVKVPAKQAEERKLARLTNAYHREVKFYSEILQDIKLWLEMNPVMSHEDGCEGVLALNVPICYYARSFTPLPFESGTKVHEFPSKEFTLVLDDLRAHGYGKRHFSVGLSFIETIEALREIVKVHAISWAMTEHSHDKVLHWKAMLKWEDLYEMHLELIQQGFQNLRRWYDKDKLEKTWKGLLYDLLRLEPELPNILRNLLKPLPSNTAVISLVHMDFWTDNLLFKENEPVRHEAEEESSEEEETGRPSPRHEIDIDCMIVDWQMVSLGRNTHDLGILMITSLDAALRREFGEEFLKFYFETFEKIATMYKLELPLDYDDLVNQYKDSCLLAVLLAVGRLDMVISEQSTIERFFDALEDLKLEEYI